MIENVRSIYDVSVNMPSCTVLRLGPGPVKRVHLRLSVNVEGAFCDERTRRLHVLSDRGSKAFKMTPFSMDLRRLVAEAVLPPREETLCSSCFPDPRPGDRFWPRSVEHGPRMIAHAIAARVSYASHVVDADLGVLLPWQLRLRVRVEFHASTKTIDVDVQVIDGHSYRLATWCPVWPFKELNQLCRDVALDPLPEGEIRVLCAAVIDRHLPLEMFHTCGKSKHPAVVRVVDAIKGV